MENQGENKMNENDWKDETCEKCVYRDDISCRRFPPNIQIGKERIKYPCVSQKSLIENNLIVFKPACAEYRESD